MIAFNDKIFSLAYSYPIEPLIRALRGISFAYTHHRNSSLALFLRLVVPATLNLRATSHCGPLRSWGNPYYSGGSKACLTDVLSLPGGPKELHVALKGAMQAWIISFAQIAKESGLSSATASVRAEEAVVRIEGSLVLARVIGDNNNLERILKALPDLLSAA